MSAPRLLVDKRDSIGFKHMDIESKSISMLSQSRKKRRRATTVEFVPSVYYYMCFTVTTLSIAFTVALAMVSNKDESIDECFLGNGYIPNRLYVVSFPIFSVLYSLGLRNIPTTTDHHMHSLIGFIISIFYFVSSLSLTIISWRCSNLLEKIDDISWICVSSLWVVAWAFFSWSRFYAKYLKDNPLQLLLFLRCICLPPTMKKLVILLPYFLTAGGILINADKIRNEECSLPLDAYSVVSATIIAMVGVIVAVILFFGRDHPVLESDREENEARGGGLDNTIDSSASTELLVLTEKPHLDYYCPWLTLTVVFRIAALVHLLALAWAFLGVFWRYFFPDMTCHVKVKEAAVASEFFLFFFIIINVAMSYIFKIESCFPSELDSKPFHSPFVKKGMQICKLKIENARKILSEARQSQQIKKSRYSKVVDLDI